jgi:hypothetical protein
MIKSRNNFFIIMSNIKPEKIANKKKSLLSLVTWYGQGLLMMGITWESIISVERGRLVFVRCYKR